MGRPWGIFFGFYKTRHILLSDSANCIVLRAVVLTQYRRVTDGQTDRRTDGIAMRRAVKMGYKLGAALSHFWGGELGPHLAQCGVDQGPPPCQVPS